MFTFQEPAKAKEDPKDKKKAASEAAEDSKGQESMEMEQQQQLEVAAKSKEQQPEYRCSGLSHDDSVNLLRACVNMINIPVEPDALNAIMRLSLRLTRDFELAAMFAEMGGIKLLLGLTQVRIQFSLDYYYFSCHSNI